MDPDYADFLHATNPTWQQPAQHSATASAMSAAPPPQAEPRDMLCPRRPRFWPFMGNLSCATGKLLRDAPDGDQNLGRSILQIPPFI